MRPVPDAIARALHVYLESKSQIPKVEDSLVPVIQSAMMEGVATDNLCIECGSPTVKKEGYEKCHVCGWSKLLG